MEPVSTEHVTAFRRFNRYFTRRIGALHDHYLGQDRPLGEARLLFEVGDGTSLRELRARLGLDAGYLSRMAKALETQGMVRLRAHPDDNRLRMIELTAAGRVEVREQNRRANVLVADLLGALDPGNRRRLTEAMTITQRLLRLAAITVRLVDGAAPDARACLDAYAADIGERFPEGFAKSALVRPEEVSGDAGAFFVAYEDERAGVERPWGSPRSSEVESGGARRPGEGGLSTVGLSTPAETPLQGNARPVGCGALRRLESGAGEIRHVWVHPDARRLGLARRLLDALEREAAARDFTVVRLDTHATLTEAQAMYRACGYTEIPRYDDNVYASHWFEKRLCPTA
jgi:ribosomal protein S18 acetylase RimI-like enzyme/DNA-binding MarR family transcriptional regulator